MLDAVRRLGSLGRISLHQRSAPCNTRAEHVKMVWRFTASRPGAPERWPRQYGRVASPVARELPADQYLARGEETHAREPGMNQAPHRLVIDTGHDEGTWLREDAGYDEKC